MEDQEGRPIPRYGYEDDRDASPRRERYEAERYEAGDREVYDSPRERYDAPHEHYAPVPPAAVAPPPDASYAPRTYDHRDVRIDQPDAPYREHAGEHLDRTDVEPPVAQRKFSLGGTFLGWAVASFFTFVFAIIGSAIFAGVANQADFINSFWAADAATLANASVITLLISMFLGYLVGGYAAGRIALWDGFKHGALVVMWPVLLAIVVAIVSYVSFDAIAVYIPAGVDATTLTTGAIVMGLLSLLVMVAGGALGGRMGERYHKVDSSEYRRRTTSRGRPL